MAAYVLRRLLWAVPMFFGITLLTFGLLQLAPGDPLLAGSGSDVASTETSEALRRAQGLDRPLWIRYGEWVGRVVRFDFGRSYKDARPVREKLLETAPRTLALTGSALFLALLLSIPLGTWAAARRGSGWDRALDLSTYVLQSLPSFWIGVMLLEWLATPHGVRLFPLQGLTGEGHDALGLGGRILDVLWHSVLPVTCLMYGSLAVLTRHVRSGVTDVLQREEWIRTARAKGLPERLVLFRHALRPALGPVVTSLGLALPALLGGSVVIEQIFGIPGMGLLAFDSLLARDHPTVLGITTAVALLTLLSTLFADVAYAWLDPRVRLGEVSS